MNRRQRKKQIVAKGHLRAGGRERLRRYIRHQLKSCGEVALQDNLNVDDYVVFELIREETERLHRESEGKL